MTFDELWSQADKLKALPTDALRYVPDALSLKTKNRLCKKQPEEATEIIQWAINHGSVETLDTLVNRRL